MSKNELIGIIGACIIVVIVVIVIVGHPPTSTLPAPELETISISAGDLFDEYMANEVAADQKYKGRPLQVTGKIGEIGRVPVGYGDFSNKAYIRLYKTSSWIGILCFFDSENEAEIARLSEGQDVTVQGRCEGCPKTLVTSDVFLLDCTIVQ